MTFVTYPRRTSMRYYHWTVMRYSVVSPPCKFFNLKNMRHQKCLTESNKDLPSVTNIWNIDLFLNTIYK